MKHVIRQYIWISSEKIKHPRTCGLIVIDIDALELQIGVAVVGAGRVDTVLVRDHLPELKWEIDDIEYRFSKYLMLE